MTYVNTTCDWCKKKDPHCVEMQDYDEGLNGPKYMVCFSCRREYNRSTRREYEGNLYYKLYEENWDIEAQYY